MAIYADVEQFQTNIANLLKARFPYLYLQTWEEDRLLSIIQNIAQNTELIKTTREVLKWKVTTGILDHHDQPIDGTKSPIEALNFIEKHDRPCIVILQDFHIYFGAGNRPVEPQVIRKLRDMILPIKQSLHPVNIIFVSPFLTLPEELQKDITIVDFKLPSFQEIRQSLQELVDFNQWNGRIRIDLNEQESDQLAMAAVGLTLSEAENAFARAMVDNGSLSINDIEIILEEKEQIIKKTGILEFVRSDFQIDDVGGLDNLKRWLNKRNRSWLDAARQYGLPTPKGVLITGVPGCGKSLISKAVSSSWQLPLLRLDMGKIFSGLVGSSEENMRKAIQTAEAISPCILWIDEIEKGFSGIGQNGDGGTSTRIFGQFLTWMQEKKSSVFVVATANRIQALPPELIRKGRFDEIFFVDLPTAKERQEILKLHINKRLKSEEARGDFVANDDVLIQLTEQCEGFVGAELEQIVIDALFEAFYMQRSIRLEDFERAIATTVPLSVTQAEQIRELREWANIRAVSATSQDIRSDYIQPITLTKKTDRLSDHASADNDIVSSRGGRAIDF